MHSLQYISDAKGKIKSVIVPFKLWESIVSESETEYLTKSKKMKARIDEARSRKQYITKEEAYAKLGI